MQMIAGYTEHAVEARGLRFNVLEWGEASSPPLVLLHGLTGHAHIWDHMAPALAERFHVFAPDQRGHGDTSHAESYVTQDFVEDLEALVAHWGIDRFALMGLSMGGHNAMSYAAAHPERVSQLCVIDIPPKMDRRNAPGWAVNSRLAETGHVAYGSFDAAWAEARAGNATAPDDNLRYRTMLNLNTRDDGTMMLKYDAKAPLRWDPEDLWVKVPSLTMPVLLVRGGLTTVLPSDVAARMVEALPNAEFVEIADSGHSVPTDRPEKLTPIVLEWLAGGR